MGWPTTVASGWSAAISPATRCVRASWMSVTTTVAPPAASLRATACPMPRPAAAVTSATRPANSVGPAPSPFMELGQLEGDAADHEPGEAHVDRVVGDPDGVADLDAHRPAQ